MLQKVTSAKNNPFAPKKAMIENKNIVTLLPVSEKVLTSSSLKFTSSHPSYSTVASSLVALNLASNAASHSSFRPKRRSHHVPTCAKDHPPIKKCLTNYLPSPSSSKVSSESQRKESPATR